MTATTDRLMANVRIHVPGATDAVLQYELYNVMNDFFQDSNIWQEDIPFKVKSGINEYQIEQSSVSSIVRLLYMVNSSNYAVFGTMLTPGDIVLDVTPSNADTFTATVALTVDDPVAKSGFPEFPEWVLDKYMTGIVDGLVGRMMAQPVKPYSNPQLALLRQRSFRATVAQAKAEALHKNINNGQTWRFPRGFANRRK